MSEGKGASHGDLVGAGYDVGGIQKGSVGAGMMSDADKTGAGKGVVSSLQSHGAKGQGISGSAMTRTGLTDAGLTPAGVVKGSPGANMMSNMDTSGTGAGVKASLQSMGAKK